MDFLKLCEQLSLGQPITAPVPLQGGFLHRMFRLTTATGDYAVKLLNPHVMTRSTANDNFRQAEALEHKLEQTDLPILPALSFGGEKMQQVDGQYLYLFPYYGGAALTDETITPTHCQKVGGILAAIHGVERRTAPCQRDPIAVDWDDYLRRTAHLPEIHTELQAARDILYDLQQKGNAALPHLPAEQAICHNDMDPKNVLWQGQDCRVIDLECLGYDSPYLELLETALCWAGYESGQVDHPRLTAFLRGYAAGGGVLPTVWEPLVDANVSRLEWLGYNLDRVLGIGCDPHEQAIGRTEVGKTLRCLTGYARDKQNILTTLYNISKDMA